MFPSGTAARSGNDFSRGVETVCILMSPNSATKRSIHAPLIEGDQKLILITNDLMPWKLSIGTFDSTLTY